MICAAGYAAERGGPEMGRFFHRWSATRQNCASGIAMERVDLIDGLAAGCSMLRLFLPSDLGGSAQIALDIQLRIIKI